MKRILLSTILSLILSHQFWAQSICQIKEFSTNDGLPQRNVSNIIQDHEGFIWFATWNGLCKYDGYTFQKFKSYPGDGSVLVNSRLHLNGVDKNNDIWCRAYDSRFYRFDTRAKKFVDPLFPIEKEKHSVYRIEKAYNLPHGATWLVCTHTVFRIENESGKDVITEYSPAQKNLPSYEVLNIQQDSDGDEWVFTNKGTIIIGDKPFPDSSIVYKELCETKKSIFLISDYLFTEYKKDKKEFVHCTIPYEYTLLHNIEQLDEDKVAIGIDTGMLVYSSSKATFKCENLASMDTNFRTMREIFKDSYGDLWIFTNCPGVIHIDGKTKQKRVLRTPVDDIPHSVKKNRPVVFEDRQGTLWVVPEQGSLSYYDRQSGELKYYYRISGDEKSRYNPIVLSSLYDGQNNFWFADNDRLHKILFLPDASRFRSFGEGYETRAFLADTDKRLWVASKKKCIRIYRTENELEGYLATDGSIVRYPVSFNADIYCMMQTVEGDIWMGSKGDGLFRLTKEHERKYKVEQFTNDLNNPYSLSHNNIYSITQDHKRRIWIGSHGGGLNLLQWGEKGEVRFLHGGNDLPYPMKECNKVRIVRDIRNTLFVGTTYGLITMDLETDDFTEVVFHRNIRKTDDASSLSGNDVMYVYEDSKKDIYVLPFSGGMNRLLSRDLLSENLQFECWAEPEGLPSELVYSMAEDPMRNLWVIAENALFKFNSQNGTFDNYDKKYFQMDVHFSEASPVIWNNKLIAGMEDGFLELNPSILQKNTYNPPVYLTEIWVQEENRLVRMGNMERLVLHPEQRNVVLKFTALDYREPVSIKYAYRMKGLEENWNESDGNRQARYINLPPGNFEFQVKSTNSDGVWFDDYVSYPIHVLPTFWETGWAVLLYVILIALLVLVVVYIFWVIYRLRHRANMEKQLADIKLRFFTDISHELRTPLTLITSPVTEVLEHGNLTPTDRRHLELVQGNTERMLQLVNQILDFRKIENRKMKLLLEQTEVVDMVGQLMNNFSLMAEEKNINFYLQAECPEVHAWIDRDKFQKIMLNLISNAFKYTPDGKSIIIRIREEDHSFTVSVQDEGIGISSEKIPHLFKCFETIVQDNILQPSSGIGLSLVKDLTELHLGCIDVKSEQGKGSEFSVSLPLDKEKYERIDYKEYILNDVRHPYTMEDERIEEDMPQEDKLKILIVEDNDELRLFLDNILNDEYRVLEAVNGREGLELALQQMPDFIVSDIAMPVMDGLDMVKAIKENRDVCHIPIILLSAKSSLDDRINGLEQGVDDYITKPFSSTFLKTRIRLLIQQRKQLQQLYMQHIEQKDDAPMEESLEQSISPFDARFMKDVNEVAQNNLDNSDFSIDDFAEALQMGRTIFYRKVKSLTGLSPIDYLQELRINRSVQLLDSGKYNISTVAYMTGFSDPKYFTKFFKRKMGVTPSAYVKQREE